MGSQPLQQLADQGFVNGGHAFSIPHGKQGRADRRFVHGGMLPAYPKTNKAAHVVALRPMRPRTTHNTSEPGYSTVY